MRRTFRVSARLQVLALSLLAASAMGTSFMLRPFPETVNRAAIIVRGSTGASHTRWAQGGGMERIYTYTEFEPSEILKGSIDESRGVIIRELGGEKDGVAMDVGGTAKFVRGEDVVLMLKGPNSDGSYDVRGMMMGKLKVSLDEKGEELLSGPALGKPGVAHDSDAGQGDTGESQNSDGRWTLDRLRDLIRIQAESGNSGQKPGNKDESEASSTKQPTPDTAASALQPKKTEASSEPERTQHGMQGKSSRMSPKFIAFALAAIIAFGAILAFFLKGKRDGK